MSSDNTEIGYRWSLTQWFFVLAWPVIVVAAGLYAVAPRVLGLDSLQAAVASRPAIAIMDVTGAVTRGLDDKSTDADLRAQQERVAAAATKLSRAGYVVLDSYSVYSYPADLEVKP